MTRRLMTGALLTMLGAGAPMASATVIDYSAVPSRKVESQPTVPTGSGFATITLYDVLDTMRVVVKFLPPTGNMAAADVRCCDAVPWKAATEVPVTVPRLLRFPIGVTYRPCDPILDLTLGSVQGRWSDLDASLTLN